MAQGLQVGHRCVCIKHGNSGSSVEMDEQTEMSRWEARRESHESPPEVRKD